MALDINTARKIRSSYALSDIFLALALNAIEDTNAMMTDLVKDPTYLKTDGIPTKQHMINVAVTFVTESYPIQLEEVEDFLTTEDRLPEGANPFEWIMREVIKQLYAERPDMLTIEFHPR